MPLLARVLRRQITYDSWTAAGLNLMLALWLMMSAWVMGYDDDRAFWVPIATGGLVGLSAGLRLGTRLEGPAFHLADLAIAAWLVVAAVAVAEADKPFWNDIGCSIVLVALAVTGLLVYTRRTREAAREAPVDSRAASGGAR
jgi:peptidoglycan/LPS O-acetylase OafA/YrhL